MDIVQHKIQKILQWPGHMMPALSNNEVPVTPEHKKDIVTNHLTAVKNCSTHNIQNTIPLEGCRRNYNTAQVQRCTRLHEYNYV